MKTKDILPNVISIACVFVGLADLFTGSYSFATVLFIAAIFIQLCVKFLP